LRVAEDFSELLKYDPETGKLVWRHRDRTWFNRDCDYVDWNSKWPNKTAGYKNDKGYVCITIYKKVYKAHRLIWFIVYGYWPNQVDHENRDRSDNRLCNLVESNSKHNTRNKGKYKNNKSGVTGVSWNSRASVWVAKGGKKHLGRFTKLQEAIEARERWLLNSDYHNNHGI